VLHCNVVVLHCNVVVLHCNVVVHCEKADAYLTGKRVPFTHSWAGRTVLQYVALCCSMLHCVATLCTIRISTRISQGRPRSVLSAVNCNTNLTRMCDVSDTYLTRTCASHTKLHSGTYLIRMCHNSDTYLRGMCDNFHTYLTRMCDNSDTYT